MAENRGTFTLDAAQTYLAQEPQLEVTPLSGRLWTVTDGVCRALFVEADKSVIAFDTLGTPGKARAYAKAVAKAIPNKPIGTIIYSHDHLDHAGFAADLAPEAEVIADEICAKVVRARSAEGQIVPTRILNGKENRLSIDGVDLCLLNPGPTHGSGNLSAYFAEEKLLYSADTILGNAKYGFMPDYHIANLVAFMREFLTFEWDVFVPGRYELTDRAGFERGCDLIEAVQLECQNAFQEFVPIWAFAPMQDYVGGKLRQQFGDMEGFEDHIGMIALRIVHHYLMGGWGLEDTPQASVLLADEVSL